jgi:hypothetical protein
MQEFAGRGAQRMPSAVKRRLLAVGALGGAALSNKALSQTELMRDGGTFELAADVSYELLESGAAQITDALGQVLEIAPEHFMVQDGQLYLLSSMYSAVGGKFMAVGDAIAASLMGLGVLGAAAGASGPSSPKVEHEPAPKGLVKVYEGDTLRGGGSDSVTEIIGTNLGDEVDLGNGAGAADHIDLEDGGTVSVETGDGNDSVTLGDDTSHILISTEAGVGVTVMSQGGSPETINITIEGSETVSDYDVSINASGELLIP